MARPLWPLAVTSAISLALVAAPRGRPWLIWNTTASAPIGLYRVDAAARPGRGDLVAVRPPAALGRWLDARGFVPLGVPLIKPVAGLAGDTICRRGNRVSVNGAPLADARDRDRRGRPLPRWSGCRRLGADDVFALNPAHQDSLDGRYFGALPAANIVGRVRPIWLSGDRPPSPR